MRANYVDIPTIMFLIYFKLIVVSVLNKIKQSAIAHIKIVINFVRLARAYDLHAFRNLIIYSILELISPQNC